MTLASSSPNSRLVRDQQPFDDPLLQRVQPDRSGRYLVLGQRLLIESNEQRVLDVANHSFGAPDRWEGHNPELSLRILTHDLPEEHGWRPIQPVIRGQGSQFYIAASRATVISGDTGTGSAFGFISPEQARQEEHLRSTIVQSPVLWMAGQRSLSAIHSACVVVEGVPVMIRGISNAGKTTLAYAALREGFSLLAEDVAFVFEAEGDLELRAVPWMLYLKQDATRFFPEVAAYGAVERYNGELKIPILIDDLFPGQLVEQASLGPTVFVKQNGRDRSRLAPLSRSDARDRLAHTRIAMEHAEANGIDVWGRLLEYPMYEFEVGSNLSEAVMILSEVAKT